MAESDLKDEYLDASDNIRHWNTLRFAELTIYIALMGALLNAIIGKSPPLPPLVSVPAKIAGLLVTILFFVLQERTMLYWYSFIARAAELEEELGYRQYRSRPPAGIVTGRNAMRLFFLIMALFWVISLFWFPA
jgi:membrane associated rhomboid family serine protease